MATPSFTTGVFDFLKGYANQIPIYANGVKIGYWSPDKNNLCSGNAFIYNEFVDPVTKIAKIHPSQWVTKDTWWRDVSVSQYCVSHNITPTWASVTAGRATINTPSGAPIIVERQQDGSLDEQKTLAGLPLGVALLGGGALTLILLMRR